MLTHLIILLDDTSVSYCHYSNASERRPISLDDLKAGLVWAMKENVNVQFVYPDYELPKEYAELIDFVDHTNIKPERLAADADVTVLEHWKEQAPDVDSNAVCLLKASRKELTEHADSIKAITQKVSRLMIVLTDIESFTDADVEAYQTLLDDFSDCLCACYLSGKSSQLSLLTDRIMLGEMNNCNAGVNNITLAPNGRFYLCPAFYYDNPEDAIGDVRHGIDIKNQQLLALDHAPICRACDAYHCKRCIWMNSRLTLDANTPSHQQCVVAHLERDASRRLLQNMTEKGIYLNPSHEIKEIDYLDPFNIVNRWK